VSVETEAVFFCPECGSYQVATAHHQMFMVNTGYHYCHSVKTQDDDSPATCLACRWEGVRKDLKQEVLP
jgi:hypothetical protein